MNEWFNKWRAALWRARSWRVALFVLALCASVPLLDHLFPPPLQRAQTVSAVVLDRHGVVLRVFPVEDGKWRLKAHIEQIDPAFIEALLAYEDKRFRAHGGVDFLALGRAGLSLLTSGRIVSGGSTITMQTARLLEPRRRTLGAKIVESLRAWQLERRFSKDEILELYLTLAPYGGNLEGIRAASWAYFGREPDDLSPDQIALLIALPQSPEARRPDLRPANAVVARERVLSRLAEAGIFAADLAAESATYPAPARRAFPDSAWHGAEEAVRRAADPDNILTTLDFALQQNVEALAARATGPAPGEVQAAIIVVDIASREVRALAGSASRESAGGWIDLSNRPRSPGSTLKPFIYGLAFDDGVATPQTRIADAPTRFDSYQPNNFDGAFKGEVSIAEALQHSLNIPAVAALDAVGARRFAAALAFAGADLSQPLTAEDDTGLAVALGGAGLTLRELALLYAALGDEGRARPLHWLHAETEIAELPPTPLMSAQSAREIVQILTQSPAPPGRMPAFLTQEAPRIAFKTGTSYGYRDAWAAGVGNGYAVVVWLGRADGAPRPGVTGRDGALPVLFNVYDAIARATPAPFSAPTLSAADNLDHAPPPLARFARQNLAPRILFPPDQAEIWQDAAHGSFTLAAEGQGRLTWYVDGATLTPNVLGDAVWYPPEPGFYEIAVADSAGRTARVKVRVLAP
ncbi:MAG: penicillin-binding protein 1C [Pseudomonadales bacterium]|jgi:penicillin-binding protein 1C|nr:penicillin-binding protein 1C [Pseudomonadales bacterium]